jgi:dTMP kinase
VSVAAELGRSVAGRFIVLEGIDGSGTTTQAQLLVKALSSSGIQARFTHEPSTGRVGRLLRQLLSGEDSVAPTWDAMALLFAADRLEHVANEIAPALSAGITVICDRYDLSSLAYQSATAPTAEAVVPWLRSINQRALRPDLTLILDVDPELAELRRSERGEPLELFEHRDLQRRLAQIYATAETLLPEDRVVHVHADVGIDEVQNGLVQAIAESFAR